MILPILFGVRSTEKINLTNSNTSEKSTNVTPKNKNKNLEEVAHCRNVEATKGSEASGSLNPT